MNEHPEELLADYVERTLGEDDRVRVEEHLATCDRCREEVQLAGQARAALLSLPELEAARGIPLAVRRRARRAPPQTQSRALRVVGAAAVAAAVVAGGFFFFTNLSSDDSLTGQGDSGAPERAEDGGGAGFAGEESGGVGSAQDQSREAPAASAALAGPPVIPIYRETGRSYDASSLAPFARKLRDDAHLAIDSGLAPTATDFFSDFNPEAFGPDVRTAIDCVLADVPPSQLIVPFKIEAAFFEGSPAYVAAFLQGPTPDDAYDRIVIWVVHRDGCGLLSLASQLL